MASTNTVDLEPMDCPLDVEEEEHFATSKCGAGEAWFDIAIGHIEDIIMDEEFIETQNKFMDKYWQEFEDTEENKFIYTDIHKEYTELIESFIEKELRSRMEDFSMAEFQKQLASQTQELEGEVFEILMTFSDFVAFKEMFLDYRASKEGRTVDLSSGFTVTSLNCGGDNGLSLIPSTIDRNGAISLQEEEPMVESLTPRTDENKDSEGFRHDIL